MVTVKTAFYEFSIGIDGPKFESSLRLEILITAFEACITFSVVNGLICTTGFRYLSFSLFGRSTLAGPNVHTLFITTVNGLIARAVLFAQCIREYVGCGPRLNGISHRNLRARRVHRARNNIHSIAQQPHAIKGSARSNESAESSEWQSERGKWKRAICDVIVIFAFHTILRFMIE